MDSLVIESFIAIDPVYSGLRAEDRNHRAITQLATFFGGTRVHTFVNCAAFVAAASLEPELYGSANCVLYCDAAAVPPEAMQDVAAAALRPSTGLLFELTNLGAHHDGEHEESATPKRAQIHHGHKNYRLGCFQRTYVVLKPRPYSNQLALEWVPDELANDRTQAQFHDLIFGAKDVFLSLFSPFSFSSPSLFSSLLILLLFFSFAFFVFFWKKRRMIANIFRRIDFMLKTSGIAR